MNALHPIAGYDDRNRLADIIFVPGLNPFSGNSRKIAVETWGVNDATHNFWPCWLHRDLKLRENGLLHTGIWLLEYDSTGTGGRGTTIDMENCAADIFAQLRGQEIGEKPILFVCHSLGGLIVKMLLERGFTEENGDGFPIVEQVRGVVFLSTPQNSTAPVNPAVRFRNPFRTTPALLEGARDAKTTRHLSEWYRENAMRHNIKTLSFHATSPNTDPQRVKSDDIDTENADGGSHPVACDHIGIAKLTSRDCEVYAGTLRFVREILTAMNPTVPVIPPTIDEVMPRTVVPEDTDNGNSSTGISADTDWEEVARITAFLEGLDEPALRRVIVRVPRANAKDSDANGVTERTRILINHVMGATGPGMDALKKAIREAFPHLPEDSFRT